MATKITYRGITFTIATHNEGVGFGTRAVAKYRNGRKLAEGALVPYGFTASAIKSAEWAARAAIDAKHA